MSYQRAIDIVHLRQTDRVGQQETLAHPAYIQELSGIDPFEHPFEAQVRALQRLDVDWVFGIPRHARRFSPGQSSQDGEAGVRHTEWGLTGSSWREEYGFADVEAVLAYEPLTALQVDPEPLAGIRTEQQAVGRAMLVTGIFYRTLFQHGIMTFGWEQFLTAAAAAPDRFQRVLQDFAEVSRLQLQAMAAQAPPVVLIHDDIALERGLVFPPDWYRQRLWPLYERLLEPVLSHPGIRVGFVSDGDYSVLLDDLAVIGFDGFIINDNMDMAGIARRLGQDRFLVGNVSTLVLTDGTVADVRQEVRRCLEEARPCGGHFIKATRDLPQNIPLDNIRAYFDSVRELGRR